MRMRMKRDGPVLENISEEEHAHALLVLGLVADHDKGARDGGGEDDLLARLELQSEGELELGDALARGGEEVAAELGALLNVHVDLGEGMRRGGKTKRGEEIQKKSASSFNPRTLLGYLHKLWEHMATPEDSSDTPIRQPDEHLLRKEVATMRIANRCNCSKAARCLS